MSLMFVLKSACVPLASNKCLCAFGFKQVRAFDKSELSRVLWVYLRALGFFEESVEFFNFYSKLFEKIDRGLFYSCTLSIPSLVISLTLNSGRLATNRTFNSSRHLRNKALASSTVKSGFQYRSMVDMQKYEA
jgi:hypothetical protein